MFFKKKVEEITKKPIKTLTLRKFKMWFIPYDNVKHEGVTYNWCAEESIACTIPEYIMTHIKSEGYVKDVGGTMYPLQNVNEIEWELIEEKVVLDDFEHRFRTFFTGKEVAEMTEYEK